MLIYLNVIRKLFFGIISLVIKPIVSIFILSFLYFPTIGLTGEPVQLSIVMSSGNATYQSFSFSLKKELKKRYGDSIDISVNDLVSAQLTDNSPIYNAQIAITIGSLAAKRITEFVSQDVRIINTMITRSTYTSLPKKIHSRYSAVFIDQPFLRFLPLIMETAPATKEVLLLYDKSTQPSLITQYENEVKSYNLIPISRVIENPNNVHYVVDREIDRNTALIILPDQNLFNINTIPKIISSALIRHFPIYSFAESHINSGVYAALFSSFEQLAMQVGDMVNFLLVEKTPLMPPPSFSNYYNVKVNKDLSQWYISKEINNTRLIQLIQASTKNRYIEVPGMLPIVMDTATSFPIQLSEFLAGVQSSSKLLPYLIEPSDTGSQFDFQSVVVIDNAKPTGSLVAGRVINALFDTPNQNTLNTVSALIDPSEFFRTLKSLAPHITTVRASLNTENKLYLYQISQAAKSYGLTFIPYHSFSHASSVRSAATIFRDNNPKTDAIWITQDSLKYHDENLLDYYINQSWEKRTICFAGSSILAKRGLLFALSPRFEEFGKSVGKMLAGKSLSPYLKAYDLSVNTITAARVEVDYMNSSNSITNVFPK